MGKKIIREKTLRDLIKIINCLNQAEDWLWFREISRRTEIPHHTTVERLIEKYLRPFVEEYSLDPFNVRFIRFKNPVPVENFLKYLQAIKNIEKF